MSVQVAERARPEGILSGPGEAREVPDWLGERQRAAWEQFESLPAPTRKDQLWRFSNVGLLDLSSFTLSPTLSDQKRSTILEQSRGLAEVAARLVFAGDELVHRDVISEQLKKRG